MKRPGFYRCSGQVSLLLLRALALLAVPALSALPQQPGGPPGGPGSGWALSYNAQGGAVTFGGSSTPWDYRIPTDANGWYSSPNSVGGSDHPGGNPPGSIRITSAGSPGIRLSWTGSGDPPKETWLLVTSTANWSASEGSGSASNGLGDPEKSDASRQEKNGMSTGRRVFRLTGGATREKIISIRAQTTASSSTQVFVATASANVVGSLANKSASLARADGGVMASADDVYTADTLLSWDDVGPGPGPTYQTLVGNYGGTWTKLSDGTTDNTSVVWSGATPAGGASHGPTAGQSYRTTTYPASSSGGKMPMAAPGASSPAQEVWEYSVRDNGDGTDLALTFQWICHFAHESFSQTSLLAPDAVSSPDYVIPLNTTVQSGTVHIPTGQLPATTCFIDLPSSAIPGFPVQDKHVGIPAYQARAGHTTPNAWSAQDLPVSYDPVAGPGAYGVRYVRS